MWFLLIIIILSPVNGVRHMCTEYPNRFCRTPTLTSDIIPKDYEDLKRLCSLVNENMECLNSYDLACNGRYNYVAMSNTSHYESKRFKAFVDQACEKGSNMNRDLGLHLPCINSRITFSDYICSKSRDRVLETYDEYYNTHSAYRRRARGSDEKNIRRDCLNSVYTTGCVLKDVQKNCGYHAFEVGLNLLRTNILVDICGSDIFKELAEILNDMDLDTKHKDILNNIFVIYLK